MVKEREISTRSVRYLRKGDISSCCFSYRNGLFQCSEVVSILCMIVIMYTDSLQTFPHIMAASVCVGVTPGIRAALFVRSPQYYSLCTANCKDLKDKHMPANILKLNAVKFALMIGID